MTKNSSDWVLTIWLDDCRPIPPEYQIWCKTSEHAIAFLASLEKCTPVHISLDHDLGNEGSGYDVAKYIEQNMSPEILTYDVHSMNPVGRKNIEAALRNFTMVKIGKDVV